jgi:hypothetical protein
MLQKCFHMRSSRARQAKWVCGTSTCMWLGPHMHAHQQACGTQLHAYMHGMQDACRGGHAGTILAGGAGAVLFLHEWSAFAWGPCTRRKIAATPTAACSRERALLAHSILREQGVGGHAVGGETQQSGQTAWRQSRWTTWQGRPNTSHALVVLLLLLPSYSLGIGKIWNYSFINRLVCFPQKKFKKNNR